MDYIKINKKATLYAKTIDRRIFDFCKPLADYFGITHFCYSKVYKDGSYIYLCNDNNLVTEYFSRIDTSLVFCEKHLIKPESYNFTLWPKNPYEDSMKLIHDYGYWQGLTISKDHEKYTETIGFAGDKNNLLLRKFYYNNYKVLEKFIEHFKINFADVIRGAEMNPAIFKDGWNFSIPEYIPQQNYDIKGFLSSIGADREINIDGNLINLTTRELECMQLINEGYSYKVIGNRLNISPRTVEEHINNLRKKIGYHYKHDLIRIYRNSLLYKMSD